MTRKAFTVIWDEDLLQDVAAFWSDAAPVIRQELTRACHEIDRTLASAPESVGRDWGDAPDQYIWSLPGYRFSIAVIYAVHREDRIAKVVRLHLVE